MYKECQSNRPGDHRDLVQLPHALSTWRGVFPLAEHDHDMDRASTPAAASVLLSIGTRRGPLIIRPPPLPRAVANKRLAAPPTLPARPLVRPLMQGQVQTQVQASQLCAPRPPSSSSSWRRWRGL